MQSFGMDISKRHMPLQLDYLTTPSGLLDIGIDFNKVDVASRCKASDELYIIAYPQ